MEKDHYHANSIMDTQRLERESRALGLESQERLPWGAYTGTLKVCACGGVRPAMLGDQVQWSRADAGGGIILGHASIAQRKSAARGSSPTLLPPLSQLLPRLLPPPSSLSLQSQLPPISFAASMPARGHGQPALTNPATLSYSHDSAKDISQHIKTSRVVGHETSTSSPSIITHTPVYSARDIRMPSNQSPPPRPKKRGRPSKYKTQSDRQAARQIQSRNSKRRRQQRRQEQALVLPTQEADGGISLQFDPLSMLRQTGPTIDESIALPGVGIVGDYLTIPIDEDQQSAFEV